jgi:hypothetical protein
MKQSSKILIIIFILPIIIFGVFLLRNNKNEIRNDNMSSEDADKFDEFSVPNPNLDEMIGYDGAPLKSESLDNSWKAISLEKVWSLIETKKDVFFLKDFGIKLINTFDITGDGIVDAVYQGNGGQNEAIILLTYKDNNIDFLEYKTKDGNIYPVYLVSYQHASGAADYKILPDEHAFYETTSYVSSGSDDSVQFVCRKDSFATYQWNPNTNLFEYNQLLTQKYIIECE